MTLALPTGPRVLVVEDDDALANSLVQYFRTHRLDAHTAGDLKTARELLGLQRFDVVVLDLNVGRDDGLSLARELAVAGHPPFVIVSARAEEADRVVGLELGADDYVVKPFSYRELIARVNRVVRRHVEPRRSVTRRRVASFGEWQLDLGALQARHMSGRTVPLTAGELGVLRALLDHPHRVLLRRELLSLTRRDDGAVFARTVDVLITRIRKKLEADPRRPTIISTVRGEGYRLDCDVHWEVLP